MIDLPDVKQTDTPDAYKKRDMYCYIAPVISIACFIFHMSPGTDVDVVTYCL